MVHKTSLDIPEDIWEDIQKRRFKGEGKLNELIFDAYRAHYGLPQARSEAGTHSPGQSPEPPAVAPVTAGPERSLSAWKKTKFVTTRGKSHGN